MFWAFLSELSLYSQRRGWLRKLSCWHRFSWTKTKSQCSTVSQSGVATSSFVSLKIPSHNSITSLTNQDRLPGGKPENLITFFSNHGICRLGCFGEAKEAAMTLDISAFYDRWQPAFPLLCGKDATQLQGGTKALEKDTVRSIIFHQDTCT